MKKNESNIESEKEDNNSDSNSKDIIKNNSEILFLYDAKRCNPNGDMDDGNKPRMDKVTKTNLVSDVRLKRYIRDYLKDFEGFEEIFVESTEGDSGERIKKLKEKNKWKGKETEEILKSLIDVHLFGAIATETGKTFNLTGPIQFNWGYSLNIVDLNKSSTITSHFKTSGNKDKEGGAGIGSDSRVKYSFIAFSGSINSKNAEHTNLIAREIDLFDRAMLRSIPLCRTRSKIGQWPRFYLRVELEGNSFLKDLRELIELSNEKSSSISEIELDITELLEYLKENNSLIKEIKFWKDKGLKIVYKNVQDKKEIGDFKVLLKKFVENAKITELSMNSKPSENNNSDGSEEQ